MAGTEEKSQAHMTRSSFPARQAVKCLIGSNGCICLIQSRDLPATEVDIPCFFEGLPRVGRDTDAILGDVSLPNTALVLRSLYDVLGEDYVILSSDSPLCVG